MNYVFPVLIVLVIMFTAVLVSQILVLLDKNSPAAFRNYLSPARPLVFASATFLTSVLLVGFQALIILTIAGLFFTAQIISTFGTTALVLLIVIVLFSLVGMLIGELFKTEETATLAAVMLGSALLFVSDVIIPIESMPSWLQAFSSQNPFVLGSTVLRRTMLFNASTGDVSSQLFALIGYCIVFGGALAIAIKLRKKL
ncbi:MAG: ABC transporter permease [Candidatus Woesearchaeota archaeon]|nr:ABC transporter permease [Candidatus Woesearchaeota archaeon]